MSSEQLILFMRLNGGLSWPGKLRIVGEGRECGPMEDAITLYGGPILLPGEQREFIFVVIDLGPFMEFPMYPVCTSREFIAARLDEELTDVECA